jgi:NAD(P)-dependent dehydrogenase (short-subunit alcohol dehydrogenase family)
VKGPYFLTQALLPVLADGASIVNVSGGMVRDNPEDHRMVSSVTALGRPGEAGDIGAAIAALLSDDNRWVTGQRIEVSGGLFL